MKPSVAKTNRSWSGLHRRLLTSHMLVAAIGLGMLLIAVGATLSLRAAALRSAQVNGPTARTSVLVLQGVQRSIAALRGWVVLGDVAFKEERAAAWARDIEPAIQDLQSLSVHWDSDENRQMLAHGKELLLELKKTEWWIEEIAQTPGNEPTRVVFEKNLEPVAEEIQSAIDEFVDRQASRPSSAAGLLQLRLAADLRYYFSQCRILLAHIVESGDNAKIAELESSLKIAQLRLRQLETQVDVEGAGDRANAMRLVRQNLPAFNELTKEVVALRKSPDANVAMRLMREEAIPIARETTQLLHELSSREAELMDQDARWIAWVGDASLVLSFALILGLAGGTYYVSQRGAAALSEPIAILCQGTRLLAAGKLDHDLPVTTQDELGELTGAFNSMRTELVRRNNELAVSNAELMQSEKRFRSTVESAPTAMVVTDSQAQIVLVNAETEKLFGYERSELIGQSISVLIPESMRENTRSKHDEYFRSAAPEKRGSRRELAGRRRDGSEFTIEVGVGPMETSEGVFALHAMVDITERKRAERQMREANAALERSNAELAQFAYIASHDLQEPLRKISAYCELLKEEQGNRLDGEGREYLEVAISGAKRLRTLILDLLSFSRVTTRGRNLEPVSATECLQASIENLEFAIRDNNATVAFDPLPEVVADESQLIQLFQNLIGNGIKYRSDAAPEIFIGGRRDGDWFEFSIRDNGIGIDSNYFERIFQIFQRLHNRRDYGGTGIGLAVCKRIVERCSGTIWLESQPGQGSTFFFTIPLAPTEVDHVRDSYAIAAD